jgi:hypothetical protein
MLDLATKGYRDLFIGNIVYAITETVLQEAIGVAMMKMGLAQSVEQNPVIRVQISGSFGFMEMRTCVDATNAINLNGFPFHGNFLVIQRPRKYIGGSGSGIVGYLTWDATYTSWMEGDLRLKTAGTFSCVLVITNVTTPEELAANPTMYLDIIEDARLECSLLGTVKSVIVPRAETHLDGTASVVGKLFVEMSTMDEAVRNLLALKVSTRCPRAIVVLAPHCLRHALSASAFHPRRD